MQGRDVRIQLQAESELRGSVVDAGGKPLAGVRVSLGVGITFGPRGQVGTMSRGSVGGSTVTDGKGMYRFPGLSRHCYYRASVGSPLSKESVGSRSVQLDQTVIQLDAIQVFDLKSADEEAPREDAPAIVCQEWMNSPELDLESLRGKVVLRTFGQHGVDRASPNCRTSKPLAAIEGNAAA